MARTPGDRERGQRVRAIRDALGEDQDVFARRLLRALPGTLAYDRAVVSKIETGGRKVTFEEVLVISSWDPAKQGPAWLAWGLPPAKAGKVPKEPERPAGKRKSA
jgi:hypothetical protein